ncbi:MAG TPA: hypothetical protein VMT17_05850 [Anaeromyxobacteraceae bacterium]|nr:hypothetical protein [Anaeromyxobacteraceae bacterium]
MRGKAPGAPRHPMPFARRLLRAILLAAGLVSGSLAAGVLGYHHLAGFRWVDALLNASMILGGMGPVDPLPNDASKIFASCYALYSGLILLATMGLLVAPFFHRALRRLQVEAGWAPPEPKPPSTEPSGELP